MHLEEFRSAVLVRVQCVTSSRRKRSRDQVQIVLIVVHRALLVQMLLSRAQDILKTGEVVPKAENLLQNFANQHIQNQNLQSRIPDYPANKLDS